MARLVSDPVLFHISPAVAVRQDSRLVVSRPTISHVQLLHRQDSLEVVQDGTVGGVSRPEPDHHHRHVQLLHRDDSLEVVHDGAVGGVSRPEADHHHRHVSRPTISLEQRPTPVVLWMTSRDVGKLIGMYL